MVGVNQPSIHPPGTLEAHLGALQTAKGPLDQNSLTTLTNLEDPGHREVETLIFANIRQTPTYFVYNLQLEYLRLAGEFKDTRQVTIDCKKW